MDVYSAAGIQQTATAASVVIYDGAETVQASVAATTLGPPASYTLPALTTSSRGLSERWLEVWSLTIGGTPYVFRQSGYLVRHAYYSVITDTDLLALHAELTDLLPSGTTDFSAYRERSRQKIERELLKKARRPHLIFDPWALLDADVYLSLFYIFHDWASSIGDGRYKELAAEYEGKFAEEMKSVRFHYDDAQSGTVDREQSEGAQPGLMLTAGPGRRRGLHYGRSVA